jgi:hypothetical protein
LFFVFHTLRQSQVQVHAFAIVSNPAMDVGFEVLTVVVMKSSVFRDIKPCSLVKVTLCSSALLAAYFTLVSSLA